MVCIFLIISCDKKTVFINDNYPRTVIPLITSESENDLKKSGNNFKDNNSEPGLKINIGNNYNAVYIKNINLDFDVEDEQVVVASDKDDKQKIKIIVLDYDSVRNKYINTWEIEKTNINYRSLTITYLDIVGDHNLEIVFSAVSMDNNHILDVFRKTHSPSGIRLYYESICSLSINGQIELLEKERSPAYNLGQKNGISFPIITYEDLVNIPEQVSGFKKTTYMWNYQANKYINAFEEIIPAEIVEEQKINKLFFEGIDAYKSFLEGQWYNVNSDELIIRFNKDRSEIAFFTSDILEIYKWSEFNYSRLNKTIDINARNELIHFITKRIFIKIENMNRIRIDIKDRENPKDIDQMNGTYERISENLIASIYTEKNNYAEKITLTGEYFGEGDILSFDKNYFYLKSGNTLKSGIYSIYNYSNELILELRFMDINKVFNDVRLYSINYDVKEMETSIINRLVLTRGVITTNLFKPFGEDSLLYLQTIEKNSQLK